MSILPKYRTGDGQRGQTTVEFVVVLPMLLLLFFLMLEFGWLLKNWIVVTNTAREADRCVLASSCVVDGAQVGDPVELIESRLLSGITGNLNFDNTQDVFIAYVDADDNGSVNAGDSLVVCLRARNEAITPLLAFVAMATALPSEGLPIAAREEMLIEFVDQSPTNPLVDFWDNVEESEDGACDFGTG